MDLRNRILERYAGACAAIEYLEENEDAEDLIVHGLYHIGENPVTDFIIETSPFSVREQCKADIELLDCIEARNRSGNYADILDNLEARYPA